MLAIGAIRLRAFHMPGLYPHAKPLYRFKDLLPYRKYFVASGSDFRQLRAFQDHALRLEKFPNHNAADFYWMSRLMSDASVIEGCSLLETCHRFIPIGPAL